MKNKIKANKITITFMEGPSRWVFPQEFLNDEFLDESCWDRFQHFVKSRANEIIDLNKKEKREYDFLGYYKTDFSVEFEDGNVYKGRYDLTKNGLEDGLTLKEHIRGFYNHYLDVTFPIEKYEI